MSTNVAHLRYSESDGLVKDPDLMSGCALIFSTWTSGRCGWT